MMTTELLLTLQQLNGVGAKTIFKIADQVDHIGLMIDTINKLCSYWKNVKGKKLQAITEDDLFDANETAKGIILRCRGEGIGLMSYYDDSYPAILKSCIDEDGKQNPPLLLYYRGNLEVLKKPGIAVIGTREPTGNGILAGKHFASKFAEKGFNIVSGLAIGCDSTGHQGALDVNGATTAFLANGLDWDSIYPKENLNLAQEIVKKGGLLLSEYPVGQSCGRYGLVARDRLQAGLSYGTIVVQTGIKGGTMHAVTATIKAGKPLFAVEYKKPEDTENDKVQGNIKLIKEEKAHSLCSTNIDMALDEIKRYMAVHNNSIQQPSLF